MTEFKPGDVGVYDMYEDYWDPGKPHFSKITMKGGGDAPSAARAVLQTAEEDWAWNLQVEPKVIKSMEAGGKGVMVYSPGGGCERMEINHSDPQTETDAGTLQAELEKAISAEADLKAKSKAAQQAIQQALQSRENLDQAEAKYRGPTAAVATEALAAAEAAFRQAEAAEQSAEKALRDAREATRIAGAKLEAAEAAHHQAEQHEALVAHWRADIDGAEKVKPIQRVRLELAALAVQNARQAVEAGALARQARERLQQAEAADQERREHAELATAYREAAKSTDDVLSGVVAASCSRLRVEAGRLVLDTGRGATYYADLSHGERWRLALDVAIDAIGERGLLTIPQEAFESLDPMNRTAIAAQAVRRGVVILTAEASGDDAVTALVIGG